MEQAPKGHLRCGRLSARLIPPTALPADIPLRPRHGAMAVRVAARGHRLQMSVVGLSLLGQFRRIAGLRRGHVYHPISPYQAAACLDEKEDQPFDGHAPGCFVRPHTVLLLEQ